MNAMEAAMWRAERHPQFSDTGVIIGILDRTPDAKVVASAHRWLVAAILRFRERVIDPLVPIGAPRWAPDPDFDLGYHLRTTRLPDPGTIEQLMAFAQADALVPFDRDRPLWHGTLVEGLQHGRAAYVFRTHHCLSDGMGAIQLFRQLHSSTRRTGGRTTEEPCRPPARRTPSPLQLTARQLATGAIAAPRIARRLVADSARTVSRPRASTRYIGSLGRLLTPPAGASSTLLRGGTRRTWRFGALECGLPELKAAGRSAGATLNDAYISAMLGGLRAYHEHEGLTLGDIPMTMPVSIRRPDDAAGGNRFTAAAFAAPAGVADPIERIRAVRRITAAISTEPALAFLDAALPILTLAPAPLVAAAMQSLQSRSDLTATNIRGVQEPAYVFGALVERFFCFGPLPGTALCSALCSHAGVCCIGLNCDGSTFRRPELLWRCMRTALDETLKIGEARRT
jgi:diacylglycerol O-acyltransferase / wax synthase